MTTRNLAGQPSQTLVWDEGRRLEEVRVGNTVEADFLYAIDDRRVRRITDGVATYYLADGTEYTIDGTDSYFTYFHSVNGRMVAFTKSDTDVTTWMGADIVNSTSNTRDENGVTAQQRYTPFGEVRIDGNLATDHTYTGQVNDETTGLAFYNARYYDPATARFITPDSIVPNPNDGQDYNRYTYVRNNPVRYSDPSGRCPVQPAYAGCTDQGHAQQCVSRPNSTGCRGFEAPTSHQAAANVEGSGFLYDAVGVPVTDAQETVQGVVAAFKNPSIVWQAIQDCYGQRVGCGTSAVSSATEECHEGFGGECAGRVFTFAIGAGFFRTSVKTLVSNGPNAPGSAADDLVVACLRSFSADTEVLMADGTTMPISEIVPGDEVWALDPGTGVAGASAVMATWPHKDTLLQFTVEGGSVTTTEDHHFWNVTDNEWQETQHIDQGDHLLTAEGHTVEAGNLDWTTAHHADAYDLTVDGLHTYFVSADDEHVLVHNCNGLTGASDGLTQLFSDGPITGRPIINIRETLLEHGFSQSLTTNRSGFLFENSLGEQVRVMSRNGGWDIRVRNQHGNYLDAAGNVGDPSATHGITVVSG